MKQKTHRVIAMILSSVLLVSMIPGSVLEPVTTEAATTLEKLQAAKAEKQKTEGNIRDTQNAISNLQGVQQGFIDELNALNDSLFEVNENLELIEQAIAIVEENIAVTETELAEAKEREAQQYYEMTMRIRYIYEKGENSFVDILLGAESFADFLNAAEYIRSVVAYDQERLAEYQRLKEEIEEKKAQLEAEQEELDSYELMMIAEQNRVMKLITQTAEVIAQYEEDLESAEAQLDAYEAALSQQTQNVAELQKKYEEELALSKAALKAKWRDISEIEWAEGDEYLLANLIYCEAGGECYEGQVAVGSVVVNRILSSKFPSTLEGVVYQRNQFSPVSNGRLAIALARNRATASCYKAAKEAMSGYTNVGQCLFFRTPIAGITPKYSIGGHIFY